MIEQIFKLTQGNEKTIEKVIIDENIHYMHMILNKDECLPEHFSNAKNVYITVVRGTLSATLAKFSTALSIAVASRLFDRFSSHFESGISDLAVASALTASTSSLAAFE